MEDSKKKKVVPSGFEPLSLAPKASMITATPRDYYVLYLFVVPWQ